MGKKNKGGGGNNRPLKPSFLKQMEQRLGEGFINRLNTEDIRKNALKIFKDLAEGNMDPNDPKVENAFNQYDFTYNLMVAAQQNRDYRLYVYQGLMTNPNYPYDQQMQRVANEVQEQWTVYHSIAVHLNNILMGITMYNGVYTRFYLQQLISEIRWKRNAFNGFFVTIPTDQDKRRVRQERRQINNDKGFHNKDEDNFFNKSSKNNM